MRKLAIAVLAVPILSVVYLSTLLGRSVFARTGFAIGLGAILAFGVILTMRPAPTTATPPSTILPVTVANFRTVVATDRALDAPVTIEFSAPMDQTSVAAALNVSPATNVDLSWDKAGRLLTIMPAGRWAPATYTTVTVDAGALAANGAPMSYPARAAFLTREPAGARIAPTQGVGDRMGVGTAFGITFDGPVDPSSVMPSIHVTPEVAGTIRTSSLPEGQTGYTFSPLAPLRANTTYRVVVDGVRDADGVTIDPAILVIRTVAAPAVVRFRPRDDTSAVARDAAISVRFNKTMDRTSTKAAFKVTVDGKAVDGKVKFAESDKVLVFEPAKALPYGQKVVMEVASSALSAEGVPLVKDAQGALQDRRQDDPEQDVVQSQHRWRRRGRGRRRELGLGRDLLPAPHELHPDRWLGHLERPLQQPRRPRRGPAEARPRHQQQGLPAVREEARRGRRLQPLHRRQPGRPAPPGRLQELHLG